MNMMLRPQHCASRARLGTGKFTTGSAATGIRQFAAPRWASHRLITRQTHTAVETPTAESTPRESPTSSSSSSSAAPVHTPSEHQDVLPGLQQEDASDVFNWYKSWYPAAAMTALKTDVPNAVQLLGMKLVVWKDQAGEWRCFEDLCPHRLAPLSEGRIHESGHLQCTYHGWLFDSSGSCSSIPQIGDPKAHATACASSRACVKNFPTQVLNGVLWVYADSSPEGWTEAISESGPSPPNAGSADLLAQGWSLKVPWFQRDVPLSFDVLLENFLDPAHVPQSHHGVVGDRDADQRMRIDLTGPVTKEGYTVRVTPSNGMPPYKIEYLPPSLVRYHFPGNVTMLLYGISTDKGWSRIIMSFMSPPGGRSRPVTPMLPPLLNWFLDNVVERSPALQHALNRNPIIDGDTYFMHFGERILYARGDHTSWARQYYMPATADIAVVSWRKWIDRFGRTLPTLPKSANDIPPLLPREQVFDRYGQHTKHCPHCSTALKSVEIGIGVLGLLAAVAAGSAVVAAVNLAAAAAAAGASAAAAAAAASSTAAAAVSATVGGNLAAVIGVGVAVALLAGAAAAALLQLRRLFIFSDYVHAEH